MSKILVFALLLGCALPIWAQTSEDTQATPAQQSPVEPNPTQQPPTPAPAPTTPGAVNEAANPVTQDLSWLIGEWQGTGTQNGQELQGNLSVRPQLDGQALLMERTSPSGYKELMVIAFDKTSQKTVATLFTSQNNSGIFVANVAGSTITFSQVTSAQGAVSERVIEQTPEGSLKLTIRGAQPGEQPKVLMEMTFSKS